MTTAKPPRRGVPRPLTGGPLRFGPFLLEARLAVGGTSEVYLARPAEGSGLPDRIIVKRLLGHLVADAEGRTMFEREAQLHAAVTHKNVVSVFGSGVTSQGEPYLAMEYVDGCDVFRLLRRASLERMPVPLSVGILIAREVLEALAAVHQARDSEGHPLGIIHRDVTPSNLYLSKTGVVKLGDFGIARSAARPRIVQHTGETPAQEGALMGKFSYLAPEQVAGEPFDHRADLFSMASALTEMAIGQPLFPGTGQLQVLLAIRDCRLEPLENARLSLPDGLVPVLRRALSRDPAKRFQDAASFSRALVPFEGDPVGARRELSARVVSVQTVSSETQLAAVRESARAMRAVKPVTSTPDRSLTPVIPIEAVRLAAAATADDEIDVDVSDSEAQFLRTGDYPQVPSFVHRADGKQFGPLTFAHLVEAIATGAVRRGDRVDYIGMGPKVIEEIVDLARLLPKGSVPPASADTVGAATGAFEADLSQTSMLDVLAHVLATGQSGEMVVEREAHDGAGGQRKDVFFLRGRLHHVASTNASELLGEFLVRRGSLAREELDLALAVLPRYGGRIGDTLIGMGLVDGVEIFRAIREQGKERMTDLFQWSDGKVVFYADAEIPEVDFPLDLDLPALMLAGMEASHPGDLPLQFLERRLDHVVVPHPNPGAPAVSWPPVVAAILTAVPGPTPLRAVLSATAKDGVGTGADVARGLEILLAMDLVRWQ